MASARRITIEFLGNSSDLQRAANDGLSSTNRLGATLKKVGKVALLGLAAGAVIAGKALFDMTKAAVEDEAAAAKLADALRNNAGATDEQVAATEKWISAQGAALGVTDDELRPALARLVTATHDVGEAQKLASLAMDVSAGSGKSLESVSTALMKAQNGQVSALSRLGINTKNAAGETITMEQAVKRMGDTFGGAAATQAETMQGKMARLKVIFSEAGEEIGARLIPVISELADWFIAKALPAISAFGAYLGETLPPIFAKVKEVITSVFGGDTQGQVSGAITSIREIITGFVELVTVVWQKWGEDILTVVKIAFDYVRGTISAALEIIRGVIDVVTGLIKGDWGQVWDGIKEIVTGAWHAIQNLVEAALGLLRVAMKLAWEALKALTEAAWNGIKDLIRTLVSRWPDMLRAELELLKDVARLAWDALKALTKAAWEALKDLIKGLIDKWPDMVRAELNLLKDVVGLAWDALKDLTRAAWEGLKDIVSNGADKVLDAVRNIPDRIGQLAGDFKAVGVKLIRSFVDGLSNAGSFVSNIVGNISDAIRGMLNAAIDKINSVLHFTIDWPGPGSFSWAANIPHLAAGGIVTRPTLALIGEAGPEAVIPLSGSNAPRASSLPAGRSDTGLTINLTVNGALDPDGVARQVQSMLLRLKRRNGDLALGLT